MGLISDLISNAISITPLIIGGLGLGFVSMVGAFIFFEFIEVFTEFQRELDEADGFDKLFELVAAVVNFVINVVNIPIQLGKTIVENIDNIGRIFKCSWELFRIIIELFTEYYTVYITMGLMIPFYLGLYYIGDVIDALID